MLAIAMILTASVTADALPEKPTSDPLGTSTQTLVRESESHDEKPRYISYAASVATAYGLGLLMIPVFPPGLVLMPPLAHAIHGNGTGAAVSLVGQVGGALSGGFMMSSLANCPADDHDGLCALSNAFAGALFGYITWGIIDVAVVAKVEVDEEPSDAISWFSITPTLDASQANGTAVGFALSGGF